MQLKLLIKKKKNCKKIFKKITSQKDSINNEHRRALDTIRKYKESKKYENNLKTMKEMEELKEDLENTYTAIDLLAKNKYDSNGFDRGGYNINGVDKYGLDRNGNNINGIKGARKKYPKIKIDYKEYDDDTLYDQYGFNSLQFNKDGYDMYGFDIDGLNKDGYDMYGFKKIQVKLKLANQNLLKIKRINK